MKDKVIIIGGGVGGLTAAHELIERGFEVHVYERREYFGGKAASTRTPGRNLPAEHGFRFFPSWYRHLPDTMSRIPYRGTQSYRDAKTVADHLVPIGEELLTWFDHEPLRVPTHVPRTAQDAKSVGAVFDRLRALGLAPGEVTFFIHRMTEFLLASDAVREARWANVTWWQFLEADSKSRAFQDLIGATTRLMVAAKAETASAYSIGRLTLRTFSDALATVDRVLDGPTSEVWIDPWVEHLRGRGVHFHNALELDSIAFPNGRDGEESLARVEAVVLTRVAMTQVSRVRDLLPIVFGLVDCDVTNNKDRGTSEEGLKAAVGADQKSKPRNAADHALKRYIESVRDLIGAVVRDSEFDAYGRRAHEKDDAAFHAAALWFTLLANALRCDLRFTTPLDVASAKSSWTDLGRLLSDATPRPAFDDCRALYGQIDKSWDWTKLEPADWRDFLRDVTRFSVRLLELLTMSPFAESVRGVGEYFVFALPVEQMAYYVNRSAPIRQHDPGLRNLLQLMECTDWMAGIQFYLRHPIDVSEGHIVCMDSNWRLTAIEQSQFWRGVELGAGVRAILSVDVSEWVAKGRYVPLEASNCTADEIAREVWGELKASINARATVPHLRDDMLVDGAPLRAGVNYQIDDNLADVYDRKKQAYYEAQRSVITDAAQVGDNTNPRTPRRPTEDLPYMWGAARRINSEPLLVNVVGSLPLRPSASTAIPNLFLAADYVRTDTDLACMEGANEAARAAVNGILEASGSLHARCTIWRLSVARDVLQRLTQLAPVGPSQNAATWVAGAAGRASNLVMNVAAQAVASIRGLKR